MSNVSLTPDIRIVSIGYLHFLSANVDGKYIDLEVGLIMTLTRT